jgi:hypothetical protein
MYDITQKYIDRKVSHWFGDIKTYQRSRNLYWNVMFKYNLSPLSDVIPPITPEEYSYWYPYHMLMKDKFSPLLIHGKEDN